MTSFLYTRTWSSQEGLYTYGLMLLAFSFYFVRLNHVAEYTFIGLVILWVAERVRVRDFSRQATFLDVPILLFLGWILITGIFAVDPQYSFVEWRKALPRFLIFWFVVYTIKTARQVRLILFASSVGLGALSLVEMVYFFWHGGHAFDFSMSTESRAGAMTGSSQWLSTYVVLGLPLMMLGMWKEPDPWRRYVSMLLNAVTIGAVIVVHTRAAWVAIIVEVIVFGLMTMKRLRWATGLMMVSSLVVIVLLAGLGKPSMVMQFQVANPESIQVRFNTWGFAIQRFIEQPSICLTGVGYGKHAFDKAFPNLGVGFHSHIHNMFLGRAVQIGIPGLLIFCWMFWRILLTSFRLITFEKQSNIGKLSLAIFLGTLGLIVRNFFDDMFVGSVVYIFWLLVGLFCVALRLSEHESRITMPEEMSSQATTPLNQRHS